MPLTEEDVVTGGSRPVSVAVAAAVSSSPIYSTRSGSSGGTKGTAKGKPRKLASVTTRRTGSGPKSTSDPAVVGYGGKGTKRPTQRSLVGSTRTLTKDEKQFRKLDPGDRFQQKNFNKHAVRQGFTIAQNALSKEVRQGKMSKHVAEERMAVVERALSAYGTQYVFDGGHGAKPGVSFGYRNDSESGKNWRMAGPHGGLDCSGLIRYAFAGTDHAIGGRPLDTYRQVDHTKPISKSQLQPGDLIFYNGNDHVALYIGGGKIIDAPQTWSHPGDEHGIYNGRRDTFDFVKIENMNTPAGSPLTISAIRRSKRF